MTPRRPRRSDSDTIRQELVELFSNFENQLGTRDIRTKVKSLIPAFRRLRDLGSSLIPEEHCGAARDRILYYFRSYPLNVISGEELMVVSGIQDWPRRVRELRVQFGWPIVTGTTARQMLEENEFPEGNVDLQGVGPDDYLLLETRADREAAYRWNLANEIRRERLSVKARILKFLRSNVGKPVTGEELRYVAKNRTEWHGGRGS